MSFKFDFDLSSEESGDINSGNKKEDTFCVEPREHSVLKEQGYNHDWDEKEKGKRMSLSTIDIGILMKNRPICNPLKEWKSNEIRFDANTYNHDGAISKKTLYRILHTEQPFRSTNNNNNNDDDDTIGISIMAQRNNTDIIPGKYEGGLKVWECSIDLCNYLEEQLQFIKQQQQKQTDDDQTAASPSVTTDSKGVMTTSVDSIAIQKAISKGGRTVELGCGHGLPGCLILKEIMNNHYSMKGIETFSGGNEPIQTSTDTPTSGPFVLFTDYNSFVVRDVTLPNIILNCFGEAHKNETNTNDNNSNSNVYDKLHSMTGLVAGDWMELSKQLQQNTHDTGASPSFSLLEQAPFNILNMAEVTPENSKRETVTNNVRFDLILASETTYTTSSSEETARWLFHHLKYDTGVGLVSMKRYYFGVGGSTDAFREVAQKSFGLTVELVREYEDGASNIRDLLRVQLLRREKSNSR